MRDVSSAFCLDSLGAPALKELGGGTLRVDGRVREIRSQGPLMPLDRVIRLTEIGSEGSKAGISYPEAASFVKFLFEQFGREKFLAAYKTLKNSDDAGAGQEPGGASDDIWDPALAARDALAEEPRGRRHNKSRSPVEPDDVPSARLTREVRASCDEVYAIAPH